MTLKKSLMHQRTPMIPCWTGWRRIINSEFQKFSSQFCVVLNVMMTPLIQILKSLLFFLVCLPMVAGESSWPHWRGPNFDGSVGDDLAYPQSFGKSTNVRWSYPTPGTSASTPIVTSKFVFLSSVEDRKNIKANTSKLLAICLDRKTGKVIWLNHAGSGYLPGLNHGNEHQLDSKSNYASPSPVVGRNEVVFFYGNGDLVCYEFDGELRWRRNLQQDYGDFCFQWTFSASPTILSNSLYLPVLQRDSKVHGRGVDGAESFILKLNLSDGTTSWKVLRQTDARMESRESFASVIPYAGNLLVAGGDYLTCHSAASGKELWRWGTWNVGHKQEWWRLVPSPVAGAGRVLVCAPKGNPVYAIDVGVKGTSAKLSWDSSSIRRVTTDVPTPLFYRDHFYILSDLKKILFKINPSGEVVWESKLPGKYKWRSSPTGADKKVFLMNHNAHVLVISSEDGSLLNSVKMGDEYDDSTRSSIALTGGSLFIRTNKILYCIE